MMTGPDRDDAAHEAREVLAGPSNPPTEEILIEVQAGLLHVPSNPPTEWYGIPGQRPAPRASSLPRRHVRA